MVYSNLVYQHMIFWLNFIMVANDFLLIISERITDFISFPVKFLFSMGYFHWNVYL